MPRATRPWSSRQASHEVSPAPWLLPPALARAVLREDLLAGRQKPPIFPGIGVPPPGEAPGKELSRRAPFPQELLQIIPGLLSHVDFKGGSSHPFAAASDGRPLERPVAQRHRPRASHARHQRPDGQADLRPGAAIRSPLSHRDRSSMTSANISLKSL